MKPKTSNPANLGQSQSIDRCWSPPEAVLPLLEWLPKTRRIWESACGAGHLIRALESHGYTDIIGTDVSTGGNFFLTAPEGDWIQATNPPYSCKPQWLERSYELGKPFALLMPLETWGTQGAQKHFRRHGIEVILLNKRLNFGMPNKGFTGSAQFPVAWFTWGLGIGRDVTYYEFQKPGAKQLSLFGAVE